MKKILYFFLASALLVGAYSCKKEVDYIPPSFAHILKPAAIDNYYVQNSATSVYKIPVGLTTVSDKDRVINFSVSSPTGAALGTQYTLNHANSITIPAGKVIDTLEIRGLFAGYPAGRRDTLVVNLTGGDVEGGSGLTEFKLVLQRYCDVVLTALAGNYTNTREYNAAGSQVYGPYTTIVKNLVSTGPTSATGQIQNLYDDGWNDITATFNWSNPANFTVSIASQATGKGYNVVSTSGTFSSCDRSISIVTTLAPGTSSQVTGYRFFLR